MSDKWDSYIEKLEQFIRFEPVTTQEVNEAKPQGRSEDEQEKKEK